MKKLNYNSNPSVFAFMMRAFWPSPGFKKRPVAPVLHIVQNNFHFHKAECRALYLLSDMYHKAELPIFFPQVLGFRLVMRAVTDPSFPEPIWNALQVRNEITQYAPIVEGDTVTLELITDSQRFLEKGAEVDFKIIASKNNTKIWESITTFYYRGRYKDGVGAPLRPPEIASSPIESFQLQAGGGLQFGGLSGDYNGIHLFSPYAKIFGFKSAFLHPHRVVGAALSRIKFEKNKGPQKIQLWFRGPVFYGAQARLAVDRNSDGLNFAVFSEDDRPSLIGSILSTSETKRDS